MAGAAFQPSVTTFGARLDSQIAELELHGFWWSRGEILFNGCVFPFWTTSWTPSGVQKMFMALMVFSSENGPDLAKECLLQLALGIDVARKPVQPRAAPPPHTQGEYPHIGVCWLALGRKSFHVLCRCTVSVGSHACHVRSVLLAHKSSTTVPVEPSWQASKRIRSGKP